MQKIMNIGLGLSLVLLMTGCETVKPWQKGTLAKPEMALVVDPLASKMDDHVYFAKEATASSSETSGGGCGCN